MAMSRAPLALRERLHGCTSLNRILIHAWPPWRVTRHWSRSEEKKRKHYLAASHTRYEGKLTPANSAEIISLAGFGLGVSVVPRAAA